MSDKDQIARWAEADKPTPEERHVHGKVDVKLDAPLDQFRIRHGYKHRSDVQIRLEADGCVFLSDWSDSRFPDRCIQAKVRFETFLKAWPQFIAHLEALDGNADA